MKIRMLKKPAMSYPGPKMIAAYEDEMNWAEAALIDGIDYLEQTGSEFGSNMAAVTQFAAEQYWYVASGQMGRDAANWVVSGVDVSLNDTSKGGYEVRVDTPVGHVELYANPPATANSDSISASQSTSVIGGEFGTSITIAKP